MRHLDAVETEDTLGEILVLRRGRGRGGPARGLDYIDMVTWHIDGEIDTDLEDRPEQDAKLAIEGAGREAANVDGRARRGDEIVGCDAVRRDVRFVRRLAIHQVETLMAGASEFGEGRAVVVVEVVAVRFAARPAFDEHIAVRVAAFKRIVGVALEVLVGAIRDLVAIELAAGADRDRHIVARIDADGIRRIGNDITAIFRACDGHIDARNGRRAAIAAASSAAASASTAATATRGFLDDPRTFRTLFVGGRVVRVRIVLGELRGAGGRRREGAGDAGLARFIALARRKLTLAAAIGNRRRSLVHASGKTALLALEGGKGAARGRDGHAALRDGDRHAARGDADRPGHEFKREIVAFSGQREDAAGLDCDDAAVRRLQLQKLGRCYGLAGLDIRHRAVLAIDLDTAAAEEDGQRGGRRGGECEHRAKRRRCEKPVEDRGFHFHGSFEIRNRD